MLQRSLSIWSLLIVAATALIMRCTYFTNESKNGYNATTWDALGYYMYLPGFFIYDDVKALKWFPEMDAKYQMSGGNLYQASELDNGGYVFKYFSGVAIMELPFFAIGHGIALLTDAPEDGFSWPYQYAIIFGAVFWFIVGCIILRKVLLRFYSETTTALTLVLIGLASNILQYVSVDGAMSHAFIFPLYAAMLWFTIRWHEQPKARTALLIGLIAGVAMISRPTEMIIIFIPILWGIDPSGKLKTKWQLVKAHRSHIFWGIGGGILGVLPQLLYWKYATGSWVYDVGSKWYFLNPWFRVLFGFEKGWFVYTPIAIFMVLGLFFLKGKPFRKAVITFCLLNIWIIIAWSDWRYGATYSTRALTQSYPIFALALAAFIERFFNGRKRYVILTIGAYFIFVNLFQIGQYNRTVLHYDHMNFQYYKAIYLDWNPTPLDFSLLDTDEQADESDLNPVKMLLFNHDTVTAKMGQEFGAGNYPLKDEDWLKTTLIIRSERGKNATFLTLKCFQKDSVIKEKRFRFATPGSKDNVPMTYACYLHVPEKADRVAVGIDCYDQYEGRNAKLTVQGFKEK